MIKWLPPFGLFLIFFVRSGSPATASTQFSFEAWSKVYLPCHNVDEAKPILWILPKGQVLMSDLSNVSLDCLNSSDLYQPSEDSRIRIASNGSLEISYFGWKDRGHYECHQPEQDQTQFDLDLDPSYRWHLYWNSLYIGAGTALGFLLLTLLFRLVYFLLETYGCCLCCCCCKDQLPPRAKKIKKALDSIEAYKIQQLDKLRENYAAQSEWIRENCAVQMERVRDNYHLQIQNIKDIRHFGTSQLQAVREQYFEQMQRIRDYSLSQLDRAQENYITQRQRLRKFSAQNYLRMRATGKYTQRTLNKVMENLPPLYLDLTNCRQGTSGAGIDDFDIEELEALDAARANLSPPVPEVEDLPPKVPLCSPLHRLPFFAGTKGGHKRSASNTDGASVYFTPSGTPVRDVEAVRKSASLKNSPARDPDPYKAVYKHHKKSKSFSHALPQKWFFSNGKGEEDEETKRDEPAQQPHQTVRAIVERVTTSEDYLNVDTSTADEQPATTIIPDDTDHQQTNGSESQPDATSTLTV